ncbi:MAG TPA: PHP domain-containing protein, partial [Chloroflexota bacterium]|nr:PHP domain-containing protein [Chloroflexota bacterium]
MEIAAAGRAAAVSDLGFSSHAPLPFATDWNMPVERLAEYAAEIRNLKATEGDVQKLWLGAEIDYIPLAGVADFQRERIFPVGFDYFVGSVHFLGQDDPPAEFDGTEAGFREILEDEYEGDIREMTGDYYARLARVPEIPGVRIIGHFDVI